MSQPLDPPAIDLHAHFLPQRYRASALAHGQDGPDGMPALPQWNLHDAIAMMDEVGIAAAALSISAPGVDFLDDARERAELCRAINEDGAAAVAEFPDRLALMASIPMPEPDDAIAEIGYAYDALLADGIGLHTHSHGVYLGDPRLDPVLAALEARAALVSIHPMSPCGWDGVAFDRPRPVVEFLFDTTRAVINLALSGALERYPSIRWVVPHSGAALPVVADRVDRLYPWIRRPGEPEVDVVAALRRLHYDLAGVPLPRSLAALLRLVETDRIVYGSDYPFTPDARVRELAADIAATPLLDDVARTEALWGNAARLLPRIAAAAGRTP